MKYIICSKCKLKKQVRHHRYKQIASQYTSKEALKKNYICRNCRKPQQVTIIETVTKTNSPISDEKISSLKAKILPQVEWLHTNGIHLQQNRDLFYKMLKNTLNDHFISDFIINIHDNKVHSITLKKIPLINEYIMEIKNEKN